MSLKIIWTTRRGLGWEKFSMIACCLLLIFLWRIGLPMPEDPGMALVRAAVAGMLLGVLGPSVGVLISRGTGRLYDRIRPSYYLLLFAILTLTGLTWAGWPTSGSVALWSGPWGWSSLLILGSAEQVPATVALATLSLAVAVTGIWLLPSLDPRRLRSGAQFASGVRSGLWLDDGNWFHATVSEARLADFSARRSLRLPRNPRLLVPWRDMQGVLRDGPAVVRAFFLVGVALSGAQVRLDLPASLKTLLAAVVLLCVYLAAGSLMGGARSSVSDPRRTRYFLQSSGSLALAHGVTPLLFVLLLGMGECAVLAAFGGSLTSMFWVLAILPAATVAALVGSYRGMMPPHLMFGFDTPFGNSALLQMLIWHASGFLGLLIVAWPVVYQRSGSFWENAVWILLGTAVLSLCARKRGSRIMESLCLPLAWLRVGRGH